MLVRLAILVAIALAAGCASSKPEPMSLDEIYTMTERVNADAEPYDLGTGDQLGERTYEIYRDEE